MKKSYFLFLALSLALVACGPTTGSSTNESNSNSEDDSSATEPVAYERVKLDHLPSTDKRLSITYPAPATPTSGEVKVLVLPLTFADEDLTFSEEEVGYIKRMYQGDYETDDLLNFYSFEEYYTTSSYGKVSFDIDVAEPYKTDIDTATYEENFNTEVDIFALLFAEYIEKMNVDIADYDSNNDGYIDAFHVIYKSNHPEVWGTAWWSYTGFVVDEALFDDLTARVGSFFFSNWTNLTDDGTLDSRTLIHESGHMFGADDYYNYDSSDDIGYPGGFLDMMDYVTGDHMAYTKMLYGWVDPYVITGDVDVFDITLSPYSETGDCIVLRNTEEGFNGTIYDEYITLSYYVPGVGVNGIDSTHPFMNGAGYNHQGTHYQKAGLQAYHIDSRAYIYNGEDFEYMSDPNTQIDSYMDIAASNTPFNSIEIVDGSRLSGSDHRLVQYLSADGVDYYNSQQNTVNNFGNPAILFQEGDALAFSNAPTTFNDGTKLDYDFEVTSMDEEGITLHFFRVG